MGVLDRRRTLHEVTTFRRDVTTDGRHAVVAFGVSLEDDLARRDFTINAIAYHPLTHEWRDPFGGAGDLARGIVRAVGEPSERFREDYLRILRALRFAARFGFEIDPPTWAAARAAAPGLAQLSAERVREEWFKGLRTARSVERLVQLWQEVGAAPIWLPGLGGTYSTAEADRVPRDPVLLTALLMTDAAAALRRLRASNAEIARVEALARGPVAPAAATPEAVRRWRAAVLGAADDLVALWRLRHGGEPAWGTAVAASRARREPVSRAELALGGNDLAALGRPARAAHRRGARRAARPGARRPVAEYEGAAHRRRSVAAVTTIAIAAVAAVGNLAGALAVIRRLEGSLRAIDIGIAFSAGFMLSVALVGVLPEVFARGGLSAGVVRAWRIPRRAPGAARARAALPLR